MAMICQTPMMGGMDEMNGNRDGFGFVIPKLTAGTGFFGLLHQFSYTSSTTEGVTPNAPLMIWNREGVSPNALLSRPTRSDSRK
jgi:hypothetical protein